MIKHDYVYNVKCITEYTKYYTARSQMAEIA